jgi:hypothetical protein
MQSWNQEKAGMTSAAKRSMERRIKSAGNAPNQKLALKQSQPTPS